MLLDTLVLLAGLLVMGIEAAYVPTDGGGGEYLVRVEPDLVRNSTTPYTLTSDVPADARDVRRVKIYVADAWPPAVERSVAEAAKRPRVAPTSAPLPAGTLPLAARTGIETAPGGAIVPVVSAAPKSWPLLIGSLLTLFLSLGANAYLGLLLASMRQRYLRDVQQAVVVR
jgi:hypothetical protein